MIGCLTEILKEDPTVIKSQELINQISAIERTRSGNIGSNTFSDLFMAASFSAYVRKMKSVDIMPIIKLGVHVVQQGIYENLKEFININLDTHKDNNILDYTESEIDTLIELQLNKNKKELSEEYYSPFL